MSLQIINVTETCHLGSMPANLSLVGESIATSLWEFLTSAVLADFSGDGEGNTYTHTLI